MSIDEHDRRSADGALASLQILLQPMTEDIRHMRQSMDVMASELRKISVLEEQNRGHDAAMQRAFDAIKQIEREHDDHLIDANAKRAKYDKAIWFTTGAAAAISILWTVFGFYVADTVRDTVKAVAEMRQHISEDRVHNADDVREIIRRERMGG